MIRTFLLLAAVTLACRAGSEAQTANPGPVRIQVPRVNVRPVLPANNYVYQYPNGYVPYTPLITVRRAPIPGTPAPGETRNLSNDPDPADHLNGLLLSRIPRARSNQLNFPARSDVRYGNRLVANVQQDLRRLGYYAGAVDGSSGPETEEAIRRYQVAHHQPVTGLLDSGMLSQLGVVTRSR
ncbi:MAG: peptidoglycan-binding protein [Verrucomicrobia bacterium]|nr:peptidoglycan-binding protein [Verrucomicrobiota bacterium]